MSVLLLAGCATQPLPDAQPGQPQAHGEGNESAPTPISSATSPAPETSPVASPTPPAVHSPLEARPSRTYDSPAPRELPAITNSTCPASVGVIARSIDSGWPDYELHETRFFEAGVVVHFDTKPTVWVHPADREPERPPYLLNITESEVREFLGIYATAIPFENVTDAWRGGLNASERALSCDLAARIRDSPDEDIKEVFDGGSIVYAVPRGNEEEKKFVVGNGGTREETAALVNDWSYLMARAHADASSMSS